MYIASSNSSLFLFCFFFLSVDGCEFVENSKANFPCARLPGGLDEQ